MAVSEPQVQRVHLINTGEGKVLCGTNELDLQDVGSLEGNCVLTTTRRSIPIMDGNPKVPVGAIIDEETVTFGFVMKEQFTDDILKQLGYGTSKRTLTTTTSSESRENEEKVLWGTNWATLKGRNIATSPAPVVTDTGATPTTYSEGTDYEIDYTEGKIRRLSGSSIDDGERVYVDYTYTKAANREYSIGGDMSSPSEFYFRFILTRQNGYRYMVDCYRCIFANPTVQNFNRGGFNTREVVLQLLADNTKPAGERFYKVVDEFDANLGA